MAKIERVMIPYEDIKLLEDGAEVPEEKRKRMEEI
jgi:hypothetical protein